MKQNPITNIIKLLAIIVAVLVGTSARTLSHLNSNTYAKGPVDIRIVEQGDDGLGNIIDEWHDITNAIPGSTYSAIPRVINYGTTEVSVSICLSRSGQTSSGDSIEVTNEHILVNLEPGWTETEETECYKYNSTLAPGELTEPLFSSVTINNLDNEHQGATFNLHLYAEAIGDIPPTPESPDTGFSTQLTITAIALPTIAIFAIATIFIVSNSQHSTRKK